MGNETNKLSNKYIDSMALILKHQAEEKLWSEIRRNFDKWLSYHLGGLESDDDLEYLIENDEVFKSEIKRWSKILDEPEDRILANVRVSFNWLKDFRERCYKAFASSKCPQCQNNICEIVSVDFSEQSAVVKCSRCGLQLRWNSEKDEWIW